MNRLRKSGFENAESLAQDVVQDACVSVIRRFDSADDFVPDNPEAYATRVVQNTVHSLGRGEIPADDLEGITEPFVPPSETDDWFAEVRVVLDHSPTEPWLTSAALACICFTVHPDAIPDDAPYPKAGATPDQARVWPALWFAGQWDLFPEGKDERIKKARGRRITTVRQHLEKAYAKIRADRIRDDG